MQLTDRPLPFALTFSRERLIKFLLFVTFFLLCTTFNLFNHDGRNFLFICFTTIAGFIIVSCSMRNAPAIGGSLLLLLIYLNISFLFNLTTTKVSSYLYSLFFLASYWLIFGYFKRNVNRQGYLYMVRITMIMYFAMLVIGQIYVLSGFFAIDFSLQGGVIHGPFGTLYEPGRSAYRYYSLSTEPSCAAFVVIILFYSYIVNTPERSPFHQNNIPFWMMLLYMVFFFKSGYGIILFLFMCLKFSMEKRNAIAFVVFGLIIATISIIAQPTAIERLGDIVNKLDLFNIFSIRAIDYSASFRILPMIHYLNNIDLLDIHFYLGHGAGTSNDFLIPLLFSGHIESYEGGFLPQFLYDYGAIIVTVLVVFLRENVLKSFFSFEMIVILLMMTNANFNTQLFWITIICFSLNKYYSRSIEQGIESTEV